MIVEEQERLKDAGADFWNGNPCGGEWSSYREFYTWIQATETYIFDLVAAYDLKAQRVCDVGCGQGPLSNFMSGKGAQVVGVDMSSASLRRAMSGADELGHALHLGQADAECLPFADGVFDLAVSSGVLHHTPDTQKGIDEIHRILRPGGTAIVMLYRTGNPKWWVTDYLRQRRNQRQLARITNAEAKDNARGTALHELYGVPIMKAFSNAESRRMFDAFQHIEISNHQPGFRRMADIIPALRYIEPLLGWFDRRVQRMWGFYQVIEATK